MDTTEHLAQIDRKDDLRFVFSWYFEGIWRENHSWTSSESFLPIWSCSLLWEEKTPLDFQKNSYNAGKNCQHSRVFITKTTKPHGWDFVPSCRCLPQKQLQLLWSLPAPQWILLVSIFRAWSQPWISDIYTALPPFNLSFLGCLGCPAPESALPFSGNPGSLAMRAAQLPNSDRTAITLFVTLLGREITKMTIFQPRHKREFPRQLLNQPASGKRDFFPFDFLVPPSLTAASLQRVHHGGPQSPHHCLFSDTQHGVPGKRNRKLVFHQEYLLSEGKIQTNSSKLGIFLPKLMLEREATNSSDSSSKLPAA